MEYLAALIVISLAALLAAWVANRARRLGPLASSGLLLLMFLPAAALWLVPENDAEGLLMLLASPMWIVIVLLGWLTGSRSQTGERSGRGFRDLVATVLVLAAIGAVTGVYLEFSHRSAQRQAGRDQEADRMRVAEAEARRCIAELARRNPDSDAAADRARGDATPIGLTWLPHEPAVFTTSYPEACQDVPAGHRYEPTGKWYGRTSGSFSFGQAPPSQEQCERAGREYVSRYNRAMVALAPNDVDRFCRRIAVDPAPEP